MLDGAMGFFSGEDKKKETYGTNNSNASGGENYVTTEGGLSEHCDDCEIECGPNCECRWCHFSSCADCDNKMCDIRLCNHECHGDKGGRYLHNEPVNFPNLNQASLNNIKSQSVILTPVQPTSVPVSSPNKNINSPALNTNQSNYSNQSSQNNQGLYMNSSISTGNFSESPQKKPNMGPVEAKRMSFGVPSEAVAQQSPMKRSLRSNSQVDMSQPLPPGEFNLLNQSSINQSAAHIDYNNTSANNTSVINPNMKNGNIPQHRGSMQDSNGFSRGSMHDQSRGSMHDQSKGSMHDQSRGSMHDQSRGSMYDQPRGSMKKIVDIKSVLEKNNQQNLPIGGTVNYHKKESLNDRNHEKIFETNNPFGQLQRKSEINSVKSEHQHEVQVEEEKPKNLGKRSSKFQGLIKNLNNTPDDENFGGRRKTNVGQKAMEAELNTIKFRSKSKDKHKYTDKVILNQLEAREIEDNIDIDIRKKTSLAGKLKRQFALKRISDLKTPDKLDKHIQEKFKRDKSDITDNVAKLDEEIRNENYSEKDKLAANIFEDFEKQESWQSYTTLLFADISTDFNAVEKNGNGTRKSANGTLTGNQIKK